MTRTVHLLMLFLLCISAFSLTSCSLFNGSARSRAFEYIRGELQSRFDRSLKDTWEGTQKAVEGVGFSIKSKRADAFSAVLKAEDAQARAIEITLEREEQEQTLVRIRVGLLGDAEFSKQIMSTIEKQLE